MVSAYRFLLYIQDRDTNNILGLLLKKWKFLYYELSALWADFKGYEERAV
jgi:hypothetical protein